MNIRSAKSSSQAERKRFTTYLKGYNESAAKLSATALAGGGAATNSGKAVKTATNTDTTSLSGKGNGAQTQKKPAQTTQTGQSK